MNTIQPTIETSPENKSAILNGFFAEIKKQRDETRLALPAAKAGLCELIKACRQKTGQGYYLRSMLYSLWNGKPTRLLEIVSLDRTLRNALLAVLAVYGCDEMFSEDISEAFKQAGLFEWFLEEGDSQ